MDYIWDDDYRDGKVSEVLVTYGYDLIKTELCDSKCNNGTAIMFTAVDTEPRMIRIEMIGRRTSGAGPLFTRIISGMDAFPNSGSFVIAVRPRTAMMQMRPLTKKPMVMEAFASSGSSNGAAC